MSIEVRITSLQSKVDELIELAKKSGKISPSEEYDPDRSDNQELILQSPQAEIRSLELWRSVVSECLGSLCYVFFVCGVSIPWTGHFPPFLSVAFASALAYGALTYRVFPKAHLNPIFTLALTAIQKVTTLRCLLFVTAQAGGAIAGSAILYGLTVPGYQGTLGATTIASHVEPMQAFGLELILSFVLTLTFVSDPTNSIPTTCILLAANLVAIPCTGGSLNPVRSLGPSFVMNKWPKHWVFWLGPILGGLIASYLHRYILRRDVGRKGHGLREIASDGVSSLDIPPADLLPNAAAPDRLLCERFEPLYGGTRSLYMKPSPILPRTNLNRSQSVYASKRFDHYASKFLADTATTPTVVRKKHGHVTPPIFQQQLQANYEALYNHPLSSATTGKGAGLLVSGPPSYESAYFKNYDSKTHSLTHGHGGHGGSHHGHHYNSSSQHSGGHGHHHARDKSLDSQSVHHHQQHGGRDRDRERDRETNRILAQYEINAANSKILADFDNPKIALNSQNKSIYYESSAAAAAAAAATGDALLMRKNNAINYKESHPEKKLIDTSTSSSCDSSGTIHNNTCSSNNSSHNGNPAPPPRFRPPIQIPMEESPLQTQHQQHRYPPSGSETPNDLSRVGGVTGQQLLMQPRKPYEHLDSSKKLLECSPKQQQMIVNQSQSQQQHHYTPRILTAEKDSLAYSRILEPLLNSKPPPQPPSAMMGNSHNNHSCSSSQSQGHHPNQHHQQPYGSSSKQYQGYCPVPLASSGGISSNSMSPNQHDQLTFSYH